MAGNNVTLTFAGDSSKLETAFDRVGSAAKDMGRDVAAGADSFDRVGEASDTVDTRAMGFRDTLTGIQDGMAGIKKIGDGDIGFESLLLLGFGIGDAASGMTNFLVPALKSSVAWLKTTKVGTLATAAAQNVVAAASKVWAGVNWLLNASLLANPIVLIVVGILLLVGVIILIATKTDWFQKLWKWIWSKIGDPVKAAWDWIKKTSSKVFDWLTGLPGKLKSVFSKVKDFVSAPFKAGFNLVSRAWNATVGKLSWTVPGWIPGIGGNTISVPKLPTFHTGGTVPGRPGEQVPIMALGGERVLPRGQSAGGGVLLVETTGGGSSLEQLLAEFFHHAVRTGKIRLTVRNGQVAVGRG